MTYVMIVAGADEPEAPRRQQTYAEADAVREV